MQRFDYQNALGRVSFPPGTTSQIITVPVIGDTLDEFDEQFKVFPCTSSEREDQQGPGTGNDSGQRSSSRVSINDVAVRRRQQRYNFSQFHRYAFKREWQTYISAIRYHGRNRLVWCGLLLTIRYGNDTGRLSFSEH